MKVIFYKDTKNEWRWRIRARNGKIVADSGEGYKRLGSAKLAVRKLCNFMVDLAVIGEQGNTEVVDD